MDGALTAAVIRSPFIQLHVGSPAREYNLPNLGRLNFLVGNLAPQEQLQPMTQSTGLAQASLGRQLFFHGLFKRQVELIDDPRQGQRAILGEVVRRTPVQDADVIECRTQDGAEIPYDVDRLAVPLENWWPDIPLGTKIAYFPESTSREEQYILKEQRSANGGCTITDECGRVSTTVQELLVVPFDSWIQLHQDNAARKSGAADEEMDAAAAQAGRGELRELSKGDLCNKISFLQDRVRELTADNAADNAAFERKETDYIDQLMNLQNECNDLHGNVRAESDKDKVRRKQQDATDSLADLTTEARAMAVEMEELRQQNQLLRDESCSLNAAIHELKNELKNQEMRTAIELEKARERVKKLQGERLILGATGDHNYGSTFPSPSDLVAKIKSIEGQHFNEWIAKALGEEPIPWPIGEDETAKDVGTLRGFVLQVLVQTVRDCHERVQICVSSRKGQMEIFVPAFLRGARGRLAKELATFERSAFENGYKEMFAEICPEPPSSKTKLAREVFQGLAVYETVSKIASPHGPKPDDLFETTRESYEDIVTNLLMAFLECEIGKVSLKFSANFANREKWEPKEFQNETIDLSYEGDTPVQGHTWVQVVIPRIFWENEGGTKHFETKASFVVCNA